MFFVPLFIYNISMWQASGAKQWYSSMTIAKDNLIKKVLIKRLHAATS